MLARDRGKIPAVFEMLCVNPACEAGGEVIQVDGYVEADTGCGIPAQEDCLYCGWDLENA